MPFDGPDGYQAGLLHVADVLDAPELLSIPDWAQRYRRLSGKSAAEPGPWRNERIPYLRAIMDALSPWHPAPVVAVMKSSQVGGSELALNWIGWTVHQRPASFLCLAPTDKVSGRWSRIRLDSMIATTPELRALLPLGRVKNNQNTLREKHYPNGVLVTGSANISDDVATVSVPNILCDDVDRMPESLEDEGDPLELALRRSTNFPRSKAAVISTPVGGKETSRIYRFWLSSTMDRYFVPCPHCGEMQTLVWEGLSWIRGRPETAMYICRECAAAIEFRQKTEMLAAGEWRSEHPEREHKVKGFHVSGLYTPVGLGDTWAQHAEAYERAEGRPPALQAFWNTRLGLGYAGDRQKLEWEELKARAEPYELRRVPRGALKLTAGVDVQADRLEAQLFGWGRDQAVHVIDVVTFPGDPTRGEVWDALDAWLASSWPNEFGRQMRIDCALVDAGYLPDHVLSFTRTRQARGIFACRGSTVRARQPIGLPTYPDVKKRRRKAEQERRGAQRYELGVTNIKLWLFEQLRADTGTAAKPVLPSERHVHFAQALGDEYYRQLTAETHDPKVGWIARANYHRNEALDTFIYARAAALHHKVGVHRYKDADWHREELLWESPIAIGATIDAAKQEATPRQLGGRMLPTSAKVKKG